MKSLKTVSDETNFINNMLMTIDTNNKSTMKSSSLIQKKGYMSKASIYSNNGENR